MFRCPEVFVQLKNEEGHIASRTLDSLELAVRFASDDLLVGGHLPGGGRFAAPGL